MVGMADLNAKDALQFGAEQVIIVRETSDKLRLKDAIGEFALILTIMESKGMEFEDVLLYDFFATSQCTSAFRVLANSKELDEVKHIVSHGYPENLIPNTNVSIGVQELCSELKVPIN
jgi:hypothetical protein